MARIFIEAGSSDGLGLLAGRMLAQQGHRVRAPRLESRSGRRPRAPRSRFAEAVVVGDVASLAETRAVAEQVNALGRCDAVIHNVAVGARAATSRNRRRPVAGLRGQRGRALPG